MKQVVPTSRLAELSRRRDPGLPESSRRGEAPPARHSNPSLERAVLHTLAYADIFDYPLTPVEVHRYLVTHDAPLDAVRTALTSGAAAERLTHLDGYVAFKGREDTVETRRRRREVAAGLWPDAVRYGRTIAALPFVRMVAVTGALAIDNVDPDADIDYLIVTEPGRLWVCRALVIALVRVARRRGLVVCPNLILSERALVVEERSLFTAHELAQMVPIAGLDTYHRMRDLNAWTTGFLPNADGPGKPVAPPASVPGWPAARRLAESVGRTRVVGRLDRWEMTRKVRKFAARLDEQGEADFGPDWCKGFFDGHGTRILDAFDRRVRALDERS